MSKKRNPILVTGSHRSGTTWAGRMLAAAPKVSYIHEPFNIQIKSEGKPKPFKYWFEHIDEENAHLYEMYLNEVLSYHFPLVEKITRIDSIKDVLSLGKHQGLALLHRINGYRPLMKDPIAFFSAEWLHERFGMDVLVMIRHPAAFCSSLKVNKWEAFDFTNFVNQPKMIHEYLSPYEAEIHEHAKNDKGSMEKAVLLWNCIHHTVNIYRKKHPDWVFARHEDLSSNPINEFQAIYKSFKLEFTATAKNKIASSSSDNNPTDGLKAFDLKRNSAENIHSWKKRLSQDEINHIRDKTSRVANLFYGDSDW